MHRMEETEIDKVVNKLSEAVGADHIKEIVTNVLHEHAKAFVDEVRDIKVREARWDTTESILMDMVNVDSGEEIPRAVATLQKKVTELEVELANA